MATRRQHSSASTADAVLLIGGKDSDSTEWIPVDGSDARPGPFTVMNGYRACTIQINHDVIVLTGGEYTEDFGRTTARRLLPLIFFFYFSPFDF